MRIEKEYTFNDIKATLFKWNNKFLLKFEQGGMEQTYKFSELDFTISEIEEMINERFVLKVSDIFSQMHQNISH